jgi:hypothetical protein
LSDEFQVQERLPDSRFVANHQFVCCRIETLHPGDEDEVAGARANAPGVATGADGARRIEDLYTIGR